MTTVRSSSAQDILNKIEDAQTRAEVAEFLDKTRSEAKSAPSAIENAIWGSASKLGQKAVPLVLGSAMLYQAGSLTGNPFQHMAHDGVNAAINAKDIFSSKHPGDAAVNLVVNGGKTLGDACMGAADVAMVALVSTSLAKWVAKDTPVEKYLIRAYNATRDFITGR